MEPDERRAPSGGIFDGMAETLYVIKCYFVSERYSKSVRRSHFALLVLFDRLVSLAHKKFDFAQDDTLKCATERSEVWMTPGVSYQAQPLVS